MRRNALRRSHPPLAVRSRVLLEPGAPRFFLLFHHESAGRSRHRVRRPGCLSRQPDHRRRGASLRAGAQDLPLCGGMRVRASTHARSHARLANARRNGRSSSCVGRRGTQSERKPLDAALDLEWQFHKIQHWNDAERTGNKTYTTSTAYIKINTVPMNIMQKNQLRCVDLFTRVDAWQQDDIFASRIVFICWLFDWRGSDAAVFRYVAGCELLAVGWCGGLHLASDSHNCFAQLHFTQRMAHLYAAPSAAVWPWAADTAVTDDGGTMTRDKCAASSAGCDPPIKHDELGEGHGESAPPLHTIRCPLLMVHPFPAAAVAASPDASLTAAQAAALVCGIIQHLIVQLRLTAE